MAVEAFSGSETVSTTEWSMVSDTAATPDVETSDGVFQAIIDFNALLAGDEFRFRVYEKVLAGSTQRLVDEKFVSGAQGTPNWMSEAYILLHGWDMTLLRTAGADRAIDWSIRKG